MIDRIVINKTASPDLPGDFSGGVTQVITKDIPDNCMALGIPAKIIKELTPLSF